MLAALCYQIFNSAIWVQVAALRVYQMGEVYENQVE